MMKEHRTLEYKETVTNTFLKTVSAFANYGGGQILFGVSDDGNIKGIDQPAQVCLDIENRINDSIVPQPDYTLVLQENERVICLTVKGGQNKPYLYKSKAYKRNDTATIEVDALEFTRLVLEGKRLHFEELPAENQDLTFEILAESMKTVTGIEELDKDVLKTLNLYSEQEGYNHAAELLADENKFPGVDIAKFGENISMIQKRATYSHMSLLKTYQCAVELYRDYYQYEMISGAVREVVERIPEAAFREAVANAFVHREWDVEAQIQIFMFDDKIEIVSPGGLPSGINEQEYLAGKISVLRNPILANVFYRLKLVEIFGTGILRIMQAYEKSASKPVFEVNENRIRVVLPVVDTLADLTEDELQVYKVLSKTILKPISEILSSVEFGKSKTTEILKKLERRKIVKVEGKGRGTKYRLEEKKL